MAGGMLEGAPHCRPFTAHPSLPPSGFPPCPCAPQYGAISNIVCFWCLAIPLAHHLAFARGWGLKGLWTGAAAANVLQASLMLAICLVFDYEGAAAAAAARFGLREPLLAAEEGGH